jgi:S-layer homology domain
MKKIIFSFLLFLFSFSGVFADNYLPIDEVFSDIKKDYKYYNEVQELYNRWILFPDSDGKLRPEKLLERDEFVWISMEVICRKCIQPTVEIEFLTKYTGKPIYFDINETNKYFYCVAEADDKSYVRWYVAWDTCEDGTKKEGEKPFCPNNKITREEAYAVIMRNSKIWTIEQNEAILQSIRDNRETESISQDVSPKNSDGTPYTFFGYFKKALSYQLVEYDTSGKQKIYKLLDPKWGKIYPRQLMTKEEFIYLAYIALKWNSCRDTAVKDDIALKMKIHEKTCKESDTNCKLSDLEDPTDTYDFRPLVETTCKEWVKNPEGYTWRFVNLTTWAQFYKYGKYVDNQNLPQVGERRIFLRVIDNCSQTAEVYSTIYVKHGIDVWIIVPDDKCKKGELACIKENDCDEDNDKLCDIFPEVKEVCNKWVDEKGYDWTITHEASWFTEKKTWSYIDDYPFNLVWKRRIDLLITDRCGQTTKPYTRIIFIAPKTLNVTILTNPIMGYAPLLVDYEGIITWGTPPYNYNWSFGDGKKAIGKFTSNIFEQKGIYRTKLIGTDNEWRSWEATVLIKVLERDCKLDRDGDGLNDCDDSCPLVKGEKVNQGCPIFEKRCGVNCACEPGYTCDITDPAICPLKGSCKPIIDKRNCTYDSTKDIITGNVVCNSCPCDRFVDFLSNLRRCDIIFPAITSPDSREIYGKGQTYQLTK